MQKSASLAASDAEISASLNLSVHSSLSSISSQEEGGVDSQVEQAASLEPLNEQPVQVLHK